MEGELAEISQVQSGSDSSDVKIVDVIPVQLVDDESYTFRAVENPQRSKYYKQTYRRAWEQMPDFAGISSYWFLLFHFNIFNVQAGWQKLKANQLELSAFIVKKRSMHIVSVNKNICVCTIRLQKPVTSHRTKKDKVECNNDEDDVINANEEN